MLRAHVPATSRQSTPVPRRLAWRAPHAPACGPSRSMRAPLLPLIVLPLVFARPAAAGICWSGMDRGGRCSSIYSLHMSRAECCSSGNPAAWSPQDLTNGEIFLYKAVSGGVVCSPCIESCAGMRCGTGRRCVVRGGTAKCVCSAHCRRRGPVCGTDGNTYRALCRLKRRACRKPSAHLTLDYPGRCQVGSCDGVRCADGKRCVLDSEFGAHCVRCSGCTMAGAPVCAVDGRTYAGLCALRRVGCERGRALPVAYKGSCKVNATCDSIRCEPRQRCLSGGASGARCVTCGECRGGVRQVCGSDRATYATWCKLQRAACARGVVIETLHAGPCKGKNTTRNGVGLKKIYKMDSGEFLV